MLTTKAESDAEFINRLSELLFGYREASNDEIYTHVILLQQHKESVGLSRAAKSKAKTLLQIARELTKIVDEAG